MTGRSRLWFVVALLFTILNLAAELHAVMRWQLEHAAIHGTLLVVGLWWMWRTFPRRVAAS